VPTRNLPPPPLPEQHVEVGAAPGFPREEFGALVRRLPAYARLAWALARDPRISKARRLAVLAGAAYVISPIDLVPGIIPLVGQLDDLLVALGAIRLALDGLKPEFRAERLGSVGLSQADLDADLGTTRAIIGWLARSSVRVGRRLASEAATVAGQAAIAAGEVAGRAAQTAGQVADRARDVGVRLSERVRGKLPGRAGS
jgi:uncharacterized membrane protein YkvA (DUF1232 family)